MAHSIPSSTILPKHSSPAPVVSNLNDSKPSSNTNDILTSTTIEFRKANSILIRGNGVESPDFNPMMDFSVTPFISQLKRTLANEGFDSPTAIQAQSWPIVLANRDVISVARTGSGKTCGFLLPGIHKTVLKKAEKEKSKGSSSVGSKYTKPFLSRRRDKSLPGVLVLAPTRELGVQIEGEAAKYCAATGLRSVCLYGGASKGPQIKKLDDGVDVVIGTPGRCNDLLDMGALDLTNVSYLVLDEADRMYVKLEPKNNKSIQSAKLTLSLLFVG
jgi:ATP-dependent RNA helicase DDX5/DBP2